MQPIDRNEEVKKLIAVLESNAAPAEKDAACRRLAIIGTKEAVPALAVLLADAEWSHMARIALEPLLDPSADEALRAALSKLRGPLLAGVIGSIGFRRDSKAIPSLVKLLQGADPMVAGAAAAALGKIGGPEAAKALAERLGTATADVKAAVGDACLWCARTLAGADTRDAARSLFAAVRKADLPPHIAAAAMRSAILSGAGRGGRLLIEALRSDDGAQFEMALRVVREIPAPGRMDALAAVLKDLPAPRRAALLRALGDRGDKAALSAVVEEAKAGDGVARVAALRALGQIGDASVVPLLFEAATSPDGEVARAARETLAGLPGKDVDAAIASAAEKGDEKVRRIAAEIAAQRSGGERK